MDKALYFLALIPSDPLGMELNRLKAELSDRYQTFSALKSPSHITMLPPLRLGAEQRDKVVILLKTSMAIQPSFFVHLRDYNHFGERTLFVGVETNEALKELHEKITFLMQEWAPEKEHSLEFHPHLTLVNRDISLENFHLAWNAFRDKQHLKPALYLCWNLKDLNGRWWKSLVFACE
jgi:2'-5' RNA ligase